MPDAVNLSSCSKRETPTEVGRWLRDTALADSQNHWWEKPPPEWGVLCERPSLAPVGTARNPHRSGIHRHLPPSCQGSYLPL
jgi:hypothetical protein